MVEEVEGKELGCVASSCPGRPQQNEPNVPQDLRLPENSSCCLDRHLHTARWEWKAVKVAWSWRSACGDNDHGPHGLGREEVRK